MEYYEISKLICEEYIRLVTADASCHFSLFFAGIKEKNPQSWEYLVGNLAHHTWDIIFYFCYMVQGAVWQNRFDISYAAGTFIRIFFDASLATYAPA